MEDLNLKPVLQIHGLSVFFVLLLDIGALLGGLRLPGLCLDREVLLVQLADEGFLPLDLDLGVVEEQLNVVDLAGLRDEALLVLELLRVERFLSEFELFD